MSKPARRETCSDFSIERILSKDVAPASSTSKLTGGVKESFVVPASFLARGGTTVHASRAKLDWLRNLCKLRQEAKARLEEAVEDGVVDSESTKQPDETDSAHFQGEELSWLRCTRYRPPKLPRKSSAGKNIKRKPGSHPRIPFTKYQLEILEDKYKSNAYLSRKDVLHLSELLHLPQSRIKIWFQNRRARERRESQTLEQTQTSRI